MSLGFVSLMIPILSLIQLLFLAAVPFLELPFLAESPAFLH